MVSMWLIQRLAEDLTKDNGITECQEAILQLELDPELGGKLHQTALECRRDVGLSP